MAFSEVPINYLTPTDKNPVFPPFLISLFRDHFHSRVLVGGTQEEFLAEYGNFRTIYENRTIQDALSQGPNDEPRPNPQWLQQAKILINQTLDEFLILVIGMGQISNGFKLVPPVADTTAEVAEEVVRNPPPAKGNQKRPTSRRYAHVLVNMAQKAANSQNPGPHGIPEEAKDNVPGPDEIIQTMVDAMKNEVDILDYHDTKPYQDHWKSMKDPDFYALATTLFKHLNDLHQGVDYVEGFRYIDRYQNLIGLLEKCKGTIYFMSRPSTYEDVLLNPHMMKLRFSDNQKNNAKKKVDNKELAERRIREYRELYGRSPPPKERALKGAAKSKKDKRAASEDSENNDESLSQSRKTPQKRRKTNTPKKGKGKAATPDATPFRSSGGSLAQGVSALSSSFLGAPPQEQDQYWISQQQQQQQQHQPVLQQFNMGLHYTPQQQQQESTLQQLQLNGESWSSGTQEPVNDQLSVTSKYIAPVSGYTGIENEIATTIYSSLFDESEARNYVDDLNTSSFQPSSLVGYQQKQPSTFGDSGNGPYQDDAKSQNGQISHDHGNEASVRQQIFQKEPVFQSHSWYSQEYLRQVNAELQPAALSPKTQASHQKVLQQQQHQQQNFQSQIPNGTEEEFMTVSPKGWDTDDQTAELGDVVRVEEALKINGTTLDTDSLNHDDFIENIMSDNLGSIDRFVTYSPGEPFGGQPDSEQGKFKQVLFQISPLSTGSNTKKSQFTDLSDISLGSDDFAGNKWKDTFLFEGPVDENGDQFFDPFALPGLASQNRMKELEMMLKKDP